MIARNSGLSLVKRRYGEILEKYKALRAEQDQDQSSTESRVADCNPALFMPIFRLCLWEYILYRTGSVRFGKGVSNDKTQCRDGKQQRTEPGVRTPAAEPPAVCRRYRRKWSRHQRRGGSGQHRRRSLWLPLWWKEQLTAFWFLQSVHFRCPDDCLKTGLFCLSEYKILLLRYMMTDFGWKLHFFKKS